MLTQSRWKDERIPAWRNNESIFGAGNVFLLEWERCSSYWPGIIALVDVPTLLLHGDDDPIMPIGASGLMSFKLVRGAVLKVYPGAPHGICLTRKDRVNTERLAFFRGVTHLQEPSLARAHHRHAIG